MSWDTIRFRDLYAEDSRNGLTKPSKVRGSGYKMINMGELFSNDRIFDIPMELVPLKENEKKNAKVEKGDLLFARQSLVLEGAGKCCIVMDVSPLTVFESHLIRVRLDNTKANPLFYYYYFKSPLSPMSTIVSQCAQAGIRGSDLQELDVSIPPLPVQNRIANVLEKYDELIENNQKQIKLLEEAAQRLYKDWFVDLHFPGYENCKIVDGVPEGWNIFTLGDLCKLRKLTLNSEDIPENTPYIGLEHMPRNDFCLSKWGMAADVNSNKLRYYKNDIVFGKIRPYFHKVGFTINNGVTSTDTFIICPSEGIWGLILMLVSSNAFVDFSYKTCKEGAKMPRADWNQMKNYKTLVADTQIQTLFERYIETITCRIKTLSIENNQIAEARDRLLPKLMSGEIEV